MQIAGSARLIRFRIVRDERRVPRQACAAHGAAGAEFADAGITAGVARAPQAKPPARVSSSSSAVSRSRWFDRRQNLCVAGGPPASTERVQSTVCALATVSVLATVQPCRLPDWVLAAAGSSVVRAAGLATVFCGKRGDLPVRKKWLKHEYKDFNWAKSGLLYLEPATRALTGSRRAPFSGPKPEKEPDANDVAGSIWFICFILGL